MVFPANASPNFQKNEQEHMCPKDLGHVDLRIKSKRLTPMLG